MVIASKMDEGNQLHSTTITTTPSPPPPPPISSESVATPYIKRQVTGHNLKPVSLILGDKSPIIIFDDAVVNKAAKLALLGIVFNKGEIYVAGFRVLVQKGIYDEFKKKLVEKAKAWVVGDPFDPKFQQGPQVDKKQFEKILSYIQIGKKQWATLLTGGKRVGNKGYYIEPTEELGFGAGDVEDLGSESMTIDWRLWK
ncbi:hypothetical protein V8G54_026379, partial [Vigna mungo]